MTRSRSYVLAAVAVILLLLSGCRTNEPPGKLDAHDVAGYMTRLGRSDNPVAKDIRNRLKSASADLARERDEARKEHIAIFPADLVSPAIPASEDAAPLYGKLAQALLSFKRRP